MILRLLNWQGIVGAGVSLALLVMLTVQKLEAVHWKRQSASFERLYRQDQAAFAATVANYRAAAEQARSADLANANRVAAKQAAINLRTQDDFEARLAAARADAQRLRQSSEADSGARRGASMPGLSVAASDPPEAAREDGLPQADALTATEQAIQLDELIKWVRRQAAVDNNPQGVASHPDD